jgi:hypothetical protein
MGVICEIDELDCRHLSETPEHVPRNIDGHNGGRIPTNLLFKILLVIFVGVGPQGLGGRPSLLVHDVMRKAGSDSITGLPQPPTQIDVSVTHREKPDVESPDLVKG